MAGSVVTEAEQIAVSLAREQGVELVSVAYKKEGPHWVLRVLIDRPEGIAVSDCQQFSEALERLMDASTVIQNQYLLEVSSAGLDRPLKKEADFDRFAGKKVRVHTYASVQGKKLFIGLLQGMKGADVLIQEEGSAQSTPIPLTAISKAHLEIEDIKF
jgi:ribosome maturation factor RimP